MALALLCSLVPEHDITLCVFFRMEGVGDIDMDRYIHWLPPEPATQVLDLDWKSSPLPFSVPMDALTTVPPARAM